MFVKVNGETMDAGIADDLGFELTGNFSSASVRWANVLLPYEKGYLCGAMGVWI